MSGELFESFSDRTPSVRGKIVAVYALLILANVAAWAWAIVAFHDYPVLLGTAALAYSFGLRHAFDADRAPPFLHQLARDVVDRGDVVGVEGVA